MSRLLLIASLAAISACDEPAPGVAPDPLDGAPADARTTDSANAMGDAAEDGAIDAEPDDESIEVDAGSQDAGPADPSACPVVASPRAGSALRVAGCHFVADGVGTRVPRATVVSGDSIARELGTPYHEAPHYLELAEAEIDLVWLLVSWRGIEPFEGQYNGAYMGRVCQHLGWAHDAGLGVVLAMHQEDFGPSVGGVGMPDWVAPRARDVESAWRQFWADRVPSFTAAWARLLLTCPEEAPMVGIAPLVSPRGDAAAWGELATQVRALATERFGPVVLFVEPVVRAGAFEEWTFEGPDVVFSPSGWGPGRGVSDAGPDVAGWLAESAALRVSLGVPLFFREVGALGAEGLGRALAGPESMGAGWAVWQDGFGGDFALRDESGAPAAAWSHMAQRTWPTEIAGSILGFGATPEGWRLTWWHDGRNQGVSHVDAGGLGMVTAVEIVEGGEGEPIWAYDPTTRDVTLVIDGPPRRVAVLLVGEE